MHELVSLFINNLLKKYSTGDKEEDFQSCYLLIMEAMPLVNVHLNVHAYLSTCCINMLANKQITEKFQHERRVEYWELNHS